MSSSSAEVPRHVRASAPARPGVQQAIRDHLGEEREAKSDDDKAGNLDDEVARASEWATQFHDHEATAKEVLTSRSLVWKYVRKVVVASSFDMNWPARVNGLLESIQLFSPAFYW